MEFIDQLIGQIIYALLPFYGGAIKIRPLLVFVLIIFGGSLTVLGTLFLVIGLNTGDSSSLVYCCAPPLLIGVISLILGIWLSIRKGK
jgi:hypothetical protein